MYTEHEHEHTHEHSHAHTHDGVEHSHSHSHEHSHDHVHPHTHEHLHEDGCTHEHTHEHSHAHTHDHTHHEHSHEHSNGEGHTPLEQLIALISYMESHNTAHTDELAALAQQLDQAGHHEAYHALLDAVALYQQGNHRLSAVLEALKQS